jgi:hypothetical protein
MLRFFALWQTFINVFMAKLRDDIEQNLPFISVLNYGGEEYIGIIINQDQFVTSFYDLNAIKTPEETKLFLEIGETWWWESNRQFPISIFCREQIQPFAYAVKTFNSKDVRVILGPVVNLMNLTLKRVKRKSVQLVRKTR